MCATSGLLPTPYCPYTRREIFIAGTGPTQPDNLYRPLQVDVATGQLATPDTPRDRVATRVYLVLPAEAQEWARENGIPQIADSRWQMADGEWQMAGGEPSPAISHQPSAVRITRPDDGTIYKITPQTPLASQRIPVQAILADGVQIARLTLFVDGQTIGDFDSAPVRTWWTLAPGRHVFSVEALDRQGNKLVGAPVTIVVTQ